MAATTEGIIPFSVGSMVEDVIVKHGSRLSDTNFASRKAEEASLRRYEAAGWLRKTVGAVGGKDLPAEPSEEDFRLGLRSGIILCNALNKVQPGSVSKVVEGPACDSVVAVPDGAALCAYQYFENVRNFLVAIEEMGLPSFEASDLEQGGKSSRIVNCVLALKSYGVWKQGGGSGSWKLVGSLKPSASGKLFMRKNSEPFMNFSRTISMNDEKMLDVSSNDQFLSGHDLSDLSISGSLSTLVRGLLTDKKQEEIPMIMESMLNKVMEEFEQRLARQNELMLTTQTHIPVSETTSSLSKSASDEIEVEDNIEAEKIEEESFNEIVNEDSRNHVMRQQLLVELQQRDIKELKHTLNTTKEGMQYLQIKCQDELNKLGKHLFGLANAASGYQRVLEENRKLYNQVQDLKGNIRVYCRVRPFTPGKSNCLSNVGNIEEGNITIICPSKYAKEGRKSFNFYKVFGPPATQEEVYADMQPLVRSVLDGYNVCIFAYGQTGSGKTYTMTGPKELTEESLGVNYRALSDLFLLSEERKDIFYYEVSVQMIEIYNEQVRDLLSTEGANKRLEIRNSSQNGINVPDATIVPVSSPSDVINVMNLGHKNRAVSATTLNDRSSRSHSCLTVHVQGKDLTSGKVLRGCMYLVDLAGSERVDKSEVTGDRLKEAQHINKSLSALGDVISSLSQKNAHVPYRNSKLTQLLQDSLGGQAKTLMFVHISPEPDAVGETISTLKFAERVSTIELGAARVNKDSSDVKDLKEQVASLKAALARKEGGSNHLQRSSSVSPEKFRMQLAGSSPSHPSWQSLVDIARLGQAMEDANNIEAQANNAVKPRKSFDLQELLMNSSPWPPIGSPGLNGSKGDEREFTSGDWIDKVMVNRQNSLSKDPLAHWEEDNGQAPQVVLQRRLSDPSKIYSSNKKDDYDVQRSRYETASTADSDDLEAATSESSEPDLSWNLNIPKASSIPNGLGSTIRKSQLKQPTKTSEIRNMIPSLIPSPSRKLSNGVSPLVHRMGRQVVSADGRRKNGIGK